VPIDLVTIGSQCSDPAALAGGGSDAVQVLQELADPGSALSGLWDREHDEHLASRALARVRVDVTEVTWEAFTRHAPAGQPVKDVATDSAYAPIVPS
jgi:hypothetical protein